MSIVPLENSLDGYVQRTLDLLLEERVYIVEETKLPIHYKLVSKSNKIAKAPPKDNNTLL